MNALIILFVCVYIGFLATIVINAIRVLLRKTPRIRGVVERGLDKFSCGALGRWEDENAQ